MTLCDTVVYCKKYKSGEHAGARSGGPFRRRRRLVHPSCLAAPMHLHNGPEMELPGSVRGWAKFMAKLMKCEEAVTVWCLRWGEGRQPPGPRVTAPPAGPARTGQGFRRNWWCGRCRAWGESGVRTGRRRGALSAETQLPDPDRGAHHVHLVGPADGWQARSRSGTSVLEPHWFWKAVGGV